MKLPIIDADGHVVEPFGLWKERMPRRFHDLMWRREVDDSGREHLFHDGVELAIEWTTGTLSTPGAVREGGRLDIDIETEVDAGIHDSGRRLELMDSQGIAVSVLFPSMMLGIADVRDADMQVAYAEVYNEWIHEFCARDPHRLLWGAVVPTADLAATIRIATAAIAKGARAVMVPPIFDRQQMPLSDPALHPLYRALSDTGIPLIVHAINPANRCLAIDRHLHNRVQWQMGYSIQNQLATMHVLDSGLLELFPELRIGFFEGDMGWVPHWFDRLDETMRKMALVSRPRTEPVLSTFRRNCVFSADMNDPRLLEAVRYLGEDAVLFASDWPHHDGTWPDPIVAIRDHPMLTDTEKRSILVHAPARFFDIDINDVITRMNSANWDASAPLSGIPPLLDQRRGPALTSQTA